MSTRFVQNYINQLLAEEEAARPVGHYSNGGKKEKEIEKETRLEDLPVAGLPLRGPLHVKGSTPTLTGSQLGKARMGGKAGRATKMRVDSITKKYKAARKQIRDGGGGGY